MDEQENHIARVIAAKRQAELSNSAQAIVAATWFLFGTRRTKSGREYWPLGQYVFALFALIAYWLFW